MVDHDPIFCDKSRIKFFGILLVSVWLLVPCAIDSVKASIEFWKSSFPLKVSYGSVRTQTVSIAEIESINCTKNHVNGTIITHTINFGSADFSCHVSQPLPIIFIKAIAIKIKANIKYITLDTSIHISFIYWSKPNKVPFTHSGVRKREAKDVTAHKSAAAISKSPLTAFIAVVIGSFSHSGVTAKTASLNTNNEKRKNHT